jgi:hypothetical protein
MIGNYQRLGLYEPNGLLTVLKPLQGVGQYKYDSPRSLPTSTTPEKAIVDETISYYQTASYLYRVNGYKAISTEEENRYRLLAEKNAASLLP